MNRPPANRAGVSLTEILLACLILGLAVVPTLTIVTGGTRSVQRSGHKVLVASLARIVLEEVKTRRYDDVVSHDFVRVLNDDSPFSPFDSFMNLGSDQSGVISLSAEHFPALAKRLKGLSYSMSVAADEPYSEMKTVVITIRDERRPGVVEDEFITIIRKNSL